MNHWPDPLSNSLTVEAHPLGHYEFKGVLSYIGRLPEMTEIVRNHVVGAITPDRARTQSWKEPPHEALANLQDEEQAAEKFIKVYGHFASPVGGVERFPTTMKHPETGEIMEVETGKVLEVFLQRHPEAKNMELFAENIEIFFTFRDALRTAWTKGPTLYMEETVAHYMVDKWTFHRSAVEITSRQLWGFLSALYLVDYAKGRTAICANPECPAPYFLKKRRTQKVCELGPCSEWAQRQYALKWWNKEGRERRAKKSAKSRKLRRKRH